MKKNKECIGDMKQKQKQTALSPPTPTHTHKPNQRKKNYHHNQFRYLISVDIYSTTEFIHKVFHTYINRGIKIKNRNTHNNGNTIQNMNTNDCRRVVY